MPRIKQTKVKFISNNKDAMIHEKLIACSNGDASAIVEIGEIVEHFLKSSMAVIIETLTVGRRSMELETSRVNNVSADRILGRLEMADIIWKDLEQYVHDKDMAQRRIKVSHREESFSANIPEPDSEEMIHSEID